MRLAKIPDGNILVRWMNLWFIESIIRVVNEFAIGKT